MHTAHQLRQKRITTGIVLHIKTLLDYLWRRKHRFVSYVVNLYTLGDYLRCRAEAERIVSEMRKECHKKWSKKSIGDIAPLQ